jgi:hypothetical protein
MRVSKARVPKIRSMLPFYSGSSIVAPR